MVTVEDEGTYVNFDKGKEATHVADEIKAVLAREREEEEREGDREGESEGEDSLEEFAVEMCQECGGLVIDTESSDSDDAPTHNVHCNCTLVEEYEEEEKEEEREEERGEKERTEEKEEEDKRMGSEVEVRGLLVYYLHPYSWFIRL